MSPDTVKYFEGLLTVYTDNIKISDIKSNIILFFLAISIPTVAAFRAQLPTYVPFFLLLLLPLFSIIALVLAIYPNSWSRRASRFSSSGRLSPRILSALPTTTPSSSRSSARAAPRWPRSCTGRLSFSASPWPAASSISRFFSFSPSAGSSFRSRPTATNDGAIGAGAAIRSSCRADGVRLSLATCGGAVSEWTSSSC